MASALRLLPPRSVGSRVAAFGNVGATTSGFPSKSDSSQVESAVFVRTGLEEIQKRRVTVELRTPDDHPSLGSRKIVVRFTERDIIQGDDTAVVKLYRTGIATVEIGCGAVQHDFFSPGLTAVTAELRLDAHFLYD